MNDIAAVESHYSRGDLLEAIRAGVERLGKTADNVSIDDLAPVDEFHIGGSVATRAFLDQVAIGEGDHVLDIGCGLGGASRFASQMYGCRVTGIDLTDTYVQTGEVLCSWVGLDDRVRLVHGDALAMDFPPGTFDRAFMLHVGMNIPEKSSLAAEVWRVLKPGAVFGIYDVMRVGDEDLQFPVPWARVAEASSVASPGEYKEALMAAGFELLMERDRRGFALEFFDRLRASVAAAQAPPPLGLHLLMGEDASAKVENMIVNVARGRVAPIELIARKQPHQTTGPRGWKLSPPEENPPDRSSRPDEPAEGTPPAPPR